MPRSLPWLTQPTKQRDSHQVADSSSPTPRARRRASPPRTPRRENANPGDQIAAARETPRHLDVLRSSRSPPSSPIQAPPAEEYLIEGFDNDDMYIMVEDEFYEVAQLFTRHLHHAEYVRRRKEAKKQNVSVLSSLSRPTDGKTGMRPETLKRKESERLQELQQQALALPHRRPRADTGSEEEDDDDPDEEDRNDDPWYGTSLHTFMTSPRKHRSLVGLETIRANTRAAAGFRPDVARHQRTQSVVSRGVSAPAPPAAATNTSGSVAAASSEKDDADDDDLEIIGSRSSRPDSLPPSSFRTRPLVVKAESPGADIKPSIHQHTTRDDHDRHSSTNYRTGRRENNSPGHSKATNAESSRNERSSVAPNTPSNIPRARKRILIDDLDDVVVKEENQDEKVPMKDDIIQGQPRKSLSNASHPRNESTAKKSRLNSVPTFLV